MSVRLRHSPAGFVRTLQMSRARMHVFVEGRQLDSYVYGRLCGRECAGSFAYRITRADELPGGQGGKGRLLDFFVSLRRSGSLIEDFKGVRYGTIFFLDKDIDDIKATRKRSPHVVYTRSYDIEGEVYRAGDLAEALAATLSLDPTPVKAQLQSQDWRDEAIALWRPWVELCVTSQLCEARCVANFGVPSRVNVPATAAADSGLIAKHEAAIVAGTSLPPANVARATGKAQRAVAKAYDEGEPERVFKGKWFGEVIDEFAQQHYRTQWARVGGFKERLVGHLAQSADYDANWAMHYRKPVAALLQSLAAP